MKLSDFVSDSLMASLSYMELVDCKVYTNNSGEVQSVELKYEPKDLDIKKVTQGGKKYGT